MPDDTIDGRTANPAQAEPPRRNLAATRRNESLKLVAASPDRLTTVVLAGAVLAPIFSGSALRWPAAAAWVATAFALHAAAQTVLRFLQEET